MPKLRQMRHSMIGLGQPPSFGSSFTTATLTLTLTLFFLKLIAVLSNHHFLQPRLLRLATHPSPS